MRGVLWLTWGADHSLLKRSRDSVYAQHPELEQHVVQLPDDSTLLSKARMYDLSPFDETLFLDADTIVLERLDYGFSVARTWGLACCICECPWARRYECFDGDEIEYNTGVLFWTSKAKPVFDAWANLRNVPSSIEFLGANGNEVMGCNDQAGFAKAIQYTGFNPWVLPLNWNFRPKWQKTVFGPVKIWHDYDPVSEGVLKWNKTQQGRVISCVRI
jgi:hypothetical protein